MSHRSESSLSDASMPWRVVHSYRLLREEVWRAVSFPGGLAVHLNLAGSGEVDLDGGAPWLVPPETCLWVMSQGALPARRTGLERQHEWLSLYFPHGWMGALLGDGLSKQMEGDFRRFWEAGGRGCGVRMRALRYTEVAWARELADAVWADVKRAPQLESRMAEFLITEAFVGCQDGDSKAGGARDRVDKIKAIVSERLKAPPTMENLAVMVGCQPSSLSRMFRRVEGVTLSRWMMLKRMERAAMLLATGECNVSEATEAVGYQSVAHFCRTFTAWAGVSPSRYAGKVVSPKFPERPDQP